jgi:hypothetical protein
LKFFCANKNDMCNQRNCSLKSGVVNFFARLRFLIVWLNAETIAKGVFLIGTPLFVFLSGKNPSGPLVFSWKSVARV